MKKISTISLRYDINPKEDILLRTHGNPAWHLYLLEDKEVYISELEGPSPWDGVKGIDPYKVFPELPIITKEDESKIKAYYKTEDERLSWERTLKEALREEEDWNKASRFWKMITKRPDSQWVKDRIETIPVSNFVIKETKYIVSVEECGMLENNLYLKSFYKKVAGLPEFIFWTVYWELSDHEEQILLDLEEASMKTGLEIHASDPPMKKIFFRFAQPEPNHEDISEFNKKTIQIAGIFPNLPKITKKKSVNFKTYKISIKKFIS